MAVVKYLFHFIFSFGLFMAVILWRNFVTSSWRLHSIFCTNHSHFWGIEANFLNLFHIWKVVLTCFLDFLNFYLQVSSFLHSFWPIFFSLHSLLLFPSPFRSLPASEGTFGGFMFFMWGVKVLWFRLAWDFAWNSCQNHSLVFPDFDGRQKIKP